MYSVLPSILALTAFAASSLSQSIDPNSVPLSTREQWCSSQISECPLICLQTGDNSAATQSNTCDPSALVYSCVCANGNSPNASEYSQTLPYYICTQYNTDCQNNCGSDNTCAAACVQDHPCGAQNPTRVNTSTISTMPATRTTDGAAASTASDGVVYTGFGGAGSATATAGHSGKSAASRMVLEFGHVYGLGLVASGIFVGFTMLL